MVAKVTTSHTHILMPHIIQVEDILSRPYLTVAEEECQTLAKERRAEYVPKWKKKKYTKWYKKEQNPFQVIN